MKKKQEIKDQKLSKFLQIVFIVIVIAFFYCLITGLNDLYFIYLASELDNKYNVNFSNNIYLLDGYYVYEIVFENPILICGKKIKNIKMIYKNFCSNVVFFMENGILGLEKNELCESYKDEINRLKRIKRENEKIEELNNLYKKFKKGDKK